MKRFLGFAVAMFFALVAIALVGGDSGAVAGHGCHGGRRCHGGLLAKHHAKKCHGGLLALDTRVPPALGLRLLERVLATLGADPAAPRGAELARWQATLAAGGIATLAGIRAQGLPEGWRFARAAPHRRT